MLGVLGSLHIMAAVFINISLALRTHILRRQGAAHIIVQLQSVSQSLIRAYSYNTNTLVRVYTAHCGIISAQIRAIRFIRPSNTKHAIYNKATSPILKSNITYSYKL